jgi:hypothetical protein
VVNFRVVTACGSAIDRAVDSIPAPQQDAAAEGEMRK